MLERHFFIVAGLLFSAALIFATKADALPLQPAAPAAVYGTAYEVKAL